MLNIKKGKIIRAQRVVFYGNEGVGKTTMASQMPDPLIIDTEGGSAQLDVPRIDDINSWDELVSTVREIAKTEGICKTLVIDTADWAERLATEKVMKSNQVKSIEDVPYGRGYVYLAQEFSALLDACDEVIAAGIHVVFTAHAKTRKVELPEEQGAYDRWEMKLSKQVSPLLKEWCDLLLFMNFKIYVITMENNATKGKGGKRVMYTAHHPCWDAKNRHGLPEELDMDYSRISHLFEAHTTVSLLDQLHKKMGEDGISEDALRQFVASKDHYPAEIPIDQYEEKFITGWLLKYWDQIKEKIGTNQPEN